MKFLLSLLGILEVSSFLLFIYFLLLSLSFLNCSCLLLHFIGAMCARRGVWVLLNFSVNIDWTNLHQFSIKQLLNFPLSFLDWVNERISHWIMSCRPHQQIPGMIFLCLDNLFSMLIRLFGLALAQSANFNLTSLAPSLLAWSSWFSIVDALDHSLGTLSLHCSPSSKIFFSSPVEMQGLSSLLLLPTESLHQGATMCLVLFFLLHPVGSTFNCGLLQFINLMKFLAILTLGPFKCFRNLEWHDMWVGSFRSHSAGMQWEDFFVTSLIRTHLTSHSHFFAHLWTWFWSEDCDDGSWPNWAWMLLIASKSLRASLAYLDEALCCSCECLILDCSQWQATIACLESSGLNPWRGSIFNSVEQMSWKMMLHCAMK